MKATQEHTITGKGRSGREARRGREVRHGPAVARRHLAALQRAALLLLALAGPLAAQFPDPILPPLPPIDPPLLPPGTTIDFDGLAEGTIVSAQYRAEGVVFEGSPRVVRSDPVSTVSPPHVLESPYGGDIPSHEGPMVFRFTSAMRKVTVQVGRRYNGLDDQAILRAYDGSGALVQRVSKDLGTTSRDVGIPLHIDAGSNRIRRVEVHYAWLTSLDGIPIEIDRYGVEAIDNLYFEGEEPPEPPSDEAPVVEITRPADGATFFGNPDIRFEGRVTEDYGLGLLTLRQEFLDSGDPTIVAPLAWSGTAPSFGFPRFPESFRVGLRPGRNRLTVTATDSGGNAHSHTITVLFGAPPVVEILSPSADSVFPEPEAIIRGRITKDLGSLSREDVVIEVRSFAGPVLSPRAVDTLTGSGPIYSFRARVPLEDSAPRSFSTVTVRARDEGGAEGSDSVRLIVDRPDRVGVSLVATQAVEGGVLVEGRRTVVRATPFVLGSGPYPRVPAVLYGYRGESELPGSPLSPFGDDAIPLSSGDTYADRHGDVSKSWNFLLPSSWTRAGEIDVVVHVDPENTLGECESCEENNLVEERLSFAESETLRVRPVRVTARHSDGVARTPTESQAIASMEAIRRAMPYSRLDILPVESFRPRRLRDPFSDGGRDDILDDVYDRFTCYDSNDVFGWIEDTFTGCSWDTYTLGLLAARPNGDGTMSLAGGLAFVPSPAGVSEATPWVAAHELAHAIGRSHAGNGHGESDGGGYDRRFPNPHGTVRAWGFDTTDWVPVRPEYSDSSAAPSFLRSSFRNCDPAAEACFTHDYLSYGQNPFWTSAYTWNGIWRLGFGGSRGGLKSARDGVDPKGGGASIGRALHVRGRFLSDGSPEIKAFYTLKAPPGFEPGPEEGSLTALALDANGKALATRNIEPSASHDGDSLRFSFLLPFPEEAVAVELYRENQLIEQRDVSGSPPVVKIDAPVAGSSVPAGGTLGIRWSAWDPDGDPLAYGVQYSADGGETWTTLAMDLDAAAIDVDPSTLPGSPKALVRVMATDGMLASRAVSAPFSVGGKPPFVVILSPTDGQELPSGDILVFEGSVSDPDLEEIDDESIRWSSDLDGPLGEGRTLDVSGLREGRHLIRLEAKDGDGNAASAEVEIFVGIPGDDEEKQAKFLRGDTNLDGARNITDPIVLFNHLFAGTAELRCKDAADVNDDGQLQITDGILILGFLFQGGPPPKEPFAEPGLDPSEDSLDCAEGLDE